MELAPVRVFSCKHPLRKRVETVFMGLTGRRSRFPHVSPSCPVLSCAYYFQAPTKMGLLIVFLAQPVYDPYSLYGVLRLTTVALLLMHNLNSFGGFWQRWRVSHLGRMSWSWTGFNLSWQRKYAIRTTWHQVVLSSRCSEHKPSSYFAQR